MRTASLLLLFVIALLSVSSVPLCSATSQSPNSDRFAIYVTAPLNGGFLDTNKGIQDSISDISNQLKGMKQILVVDRPDKADIVLTVVGRGAGSATHPVGRKQRNILTKRRGSLQPTKSSDISSFNAAVPTRGRARSVKPAKPPLSLTARRRRLRTIPSARRTAGCSTCSRMPLRVRIRCSHCRCTTPSPGTKDQTRASTP